jgi:hypothetical protein
MQNVVDTLKQKNGAKFPIVEDTDLLGGYRCVKVTKQRNDIPKSYRKIGMRVYVESIDKEFMLRGGLTNEFWGEVPILPTGNQGSPDRDMDVDDHFADVSFDITPYGSAEVIGSDEASITVSGDITGHLIGGQSTVTVGGSTYTVESFSLQSGNTVIAVMEAVQSPVSRTLYHGYRLDITLHDFGGNSCNAYITDPDGNRVSPSIRQVASSVTVWYAHPQLEAHVFRASYRKSA